MSPESHELIQAIVDAHKNFDAPTGSPFISYDENGETNRFMTAIWRGIIDHAVAQNFPAVEVDFKKKPEPRPKWVYEPDVERYYFQVRDEDISELQEHGAQAAARLIGSINRQLPITNGGLITIFVTVSR